MVHPDPEARFLGFGAEEDVFPHKLRPVIRSGEPWLRDFFKDCPFDEGHPKAEVVHLIYPLHIPRGEEHPTFFLGGREFDIRAALNTVRPNDIFVMGEEAFDRVLREAHVGINEEDVAGPRLEGFPDKRRALVTEERPLGDKELSVGVRLDEGH